MHDGFPQQFSIFLHCITVHRKKQWLCGDENGCIPLSGMCFLGKKKTGPQPGFALLCLGSKYWTATLSKTKKVSFHCSLRCWWKRSGASSLQCTVPESFDRHNIRFQLIIPASIRFPNILSELIAALRWNPTFREHKMPLGYSLQYWFRSGSVDSSE